MNRCLSSAFIIIVIQSYLLLNAQPGEVKNKKLTVFYLQSSHIINEDGAELSGAEFKPDVY